MYIKRLIPACSAADPLPNRSETKMELIVMMQNRIEFVHPLCSCCADRSLRLSSIHVPFTIHTATRIRTQQFHTSNLCTFAGMCKIVQTEALHACEFQIRVSQLNPKSSDTLPTTRLSALVAGVYWICALSRTECNKKKKKMKWWIRADSGFPIRFRFSNGIKLLVDVNALEIGWRRETGRKRHGTNESITH